MRRILSIAIFAVFTVPLVAFGQQCEQQDCPAGDGPQTPYERGYSEFITLAYQGAYGRAANCFELRREYIKLTSAASSGSSALHAEAQRFVATLFMDQTSYDSSDLTVYTQTSAYEAIRPMSPNDRSVLSAFIADLYRAFLQREPDASGQCFWTNDACGNTTAEASRKHPIRAFEVSIEFGALVDGLYDDGLPEGCCLHPPCL